MKDQNQIKELVGEITYLNDEYRAGNPQVTDQEYDALLDQLKSLDPSNSLLSKGIIETVKSNPRMRKLKSKMASMNKEKSVDSTKNWLYSLGCKDDELVVMSPKYNGISIENDGDSGSYSTRGDGEYGQNCDKHFQSIEHGVNSFDVTIGEAIISKYNWEKNFKGQVAPSGKPYKLNNATVAGLLNCDEPTKELDYVEFVRYGIASGVNLDLNKSLQLDILQEEYESPVEYLLIPIGDLTEEVCDKFYEANNQLYPIDGLIIELNRYTLRNKLGRESNGNPAYARALKLDKWVEEFDTVITGHDFTISKQGKLKGVVKFEPHIVNGTEVKQATFYNAAFLEDFCLHSGVNITVKKSGEIIPKIVAVEGIHIPIKSEYKVTSDYLKAYQEAILKLSEIVPTHKNHQTDLIFCPSCKEIMKWDESDIELICSNPNCPDRLVSKLEHFITALGIEEMGRPTVLSLFNAGYKTPQAIFSITREQFSSIPGLGSASAETFLKQVEKIKKEGVPYARLMYALDLFEGSIGEKTAQMILDECGGIPISTFENNKSRLLKIKGVEEKTATCFLNAIKDSGQTISFIPMSYITSPAKVATSNKYEGFSVCFSGIRDKSLEEVIISGGGKIASGVSKTTTHLIVADPGQSTSKTVKAREIGCIVLTIDQFKELQ